MERVKRRWWTWAVSLVAAAVIFGAVVSGLFQLAVLALPSYREDLSGWVTRIAKRPVQIGGVDLVWRGIYPRLDLSAITLYDELGAEVLSADRLSLGFNLLRLLRGDYLPDRLELSGLSVAADVDLDGKLRIAGYEAARRGNRSQDWARDLQRFRYVRLEDCEVLYSDARLDAQAWPLRARRIDLVQSAGGFELDGVLHLQASQGQDVAFSADISGEVLDLKTWNGDFEADTDGLQPQGWLAAWLAPDAQIGAEGLDVDLEGRLLAGRLDRMLIDVEAEAIVAARAGRSSGGSELRASVVIEGLPRGWQLDLRELQLDAEDLARGRLRSIPGKYGREIDVDLDRLRYTPLAFWFELWREPPAWVEMAARAGGEAESVVLRLRPQADALHYSLRARLTDLSLRADARVGFAGLSGELTADHNGGRLQVVEAPLRLELPRVFKEPVALDHLAGHWQWRRVLQGQTRGWRLQSENLLARVDSLEGRGRIELQIPDAVQEAVATAAVVAEPIATAMTDSVEIEPAPLAPMPATPQIDLTLELSAGDLLDAKRLMPQHWPQHLRDWLQRGIVRGGVPQAQLAIRGPLADFPYHRRPTGVWTLDLDVADATLKFAPDWPDIRELAAHLHFTGNSLDVKVASGTAAGSRIIDARARFADFDERLLQIEAAIAGGLPEQYAFLRDSPLHKRLSGLVDGTRAVGDARVNLKLDIPLRDVQTTVLSGQVQVEDAQLFIGKLETPVSAITGSLAFDNTGVRSEGLAARFAEIPLSLQIEPRDGTRGVVVGDFAFAPRADGEGASRYIPTEVRSRLSGQSQWQVELPIRDADTALLLSSDLLGTRVDLPAPLAKAIDTAAPLRLRIGSDAQASVRLNLDYSAQLGLNLILGPGAGGATPGATAATNDAVVLRGLHARLGAPAPLAVDGRRVLDGRIAVLDLAQFAFLAGKGESDAQLDLAEVDIDLLRWRSFEAGPLRLKYEPTAPGWRLRLDGEAARGALDWQRDTNTLAGDFELLALRTPLPEDRVEVATAALTAAPPVDPARWPQLNLLCKDLRLGEQALGRLTLRSAHIPGGQRLHQLSLADGDVDLEATGQWRRAEQQSSATLRFDLISGDVGALLKAFRYTPNLEAKRSEFNAALEWSPSATGLEWAQARGRILADVTDGQLRAVQPGVGRVLGLVNFYAIPRRLTLNFDDVVGQGLSFDRIAGAFDLADGVATTDDLNIEAPSLRMEVRGKVGLAARDYDQRVTVYPDVSAGVTLGAALLGGPAVGALVLLAQELLDKPLDQATQLAYRVTGSWDNPLIERADTAAPAAAPAGTDPAPSAVSPVSAAIPAGNR